MDAAIESLGVGRFQLPILIATGLTWSGDAIEMSVMAYVLPALKDEWKIPQAAADSFASVLFFGMLLGALPWGLLSDSFGRRVGWLSTTALTAIAGMLSAASPEGSVGLLLVLRTAVGVGLAGTNLGFALSSEWLPRHARGTLLMLFELFFVFGSALVVLLSWLFLSKRGGWRWVLILSTVPLWVALALSRLVPESPRWLLSHKRAQAATDTLRRAARINGRPPPLPDGATLAAYDDDDGAATRAASASATNSNSHALPPCPTHRIAIATRSGVSHVFTTIFDKRLRRTSLAICAGWFSAWFSYFGAILLTPKMLAYALHDDTSVYASWSSLLATLAEIPGLLLATCAINRIGRVPTIATSFISASLALCLSAVVHYFAATNTRIGALGVLQLLLVAISRLSAFGGFSALYVLTAESFPTNHRATAFGVVSACSRLAGIVTPFVAGSLWDVTPIGALMCYAAAALVCASVLWLFVADTRDAAMPDELTALSAEALGEGGSEDPRHAAGDFA